VSSTLHRTTAPVLLGLKRMPLRVRLVAIVLTLLAATLLLTSVGTAYLMQRDLLSRVDTELAAVSAPVAQQNMDQATGQAPAWAPTGYAFVLMTASGRLVTATNPTGERLHPDVPSLPITDPRVRNSRPFTVESTDGDLTWRFIAGTATVNGTPATFAVGVPLSSVNQTVKRLLGLAGVISAVALAGSALLGWYAVRRAFRPLAEIEDTAAGIASGDLSRRIPIREADDEISSLSRSLNRMLTQVESSFAVQEASEERMRRFVADASHELRTPLATVRGYAELYRQGAVSGPDGVAAAMNRIEAESGRMSVLVEDLLTLARLDEAPAASMQEVDLTVLAADATADARVRAPERAIRLVSRGDELQPTMAWGSESQLRQVVTNLVANALRHTPSGTPVEIAVGPDGDDAVVEVRDHGPGIPADQRNKVFERFFKSDPSRARDSGGGNGLGLAIVAAIVASHGGLVGVADTPGGGATFVVRIPTGHSQSPHSASSPLAG
jgi:two-component system OmpR family sensor kinase